MPKPSDFKPGESTREYEGLYYAWVAPSGRFYPCDDHQHHDLAKAILMGVHGETSWDPERELELRGYVKLDARRHPNPFWDLHAEPDDEDAYLMEASWYNCGRATRYQRRTMAEWGIVNEVMRLNTHESAENEDNLAHYQQYRTLDGD